MLYMEVKHALHGGETNHLSLWYRNQSKFLACMPCSLSNSECMRGLASQLRRLMVERILNTVKSMKCNPHDVRVCVSFRMVLPLVL